MLNAAYTDSTWKSLQSAMNCLYIFCRVKNRPNILPFGLDILIPFTSWALTEKKLKHTTVSQYLHAIELYHKLRGFEDYTVENTIIKLLLKGSENMSIYTSKKNTNRNVMTLPLLKILGHEIASMDWSKFEKQLVWTVSCISFFGSFRIGEILCNNSSEFDPDSSLTWERVKIQLDSILFHIKSPKSGNISGDFVDVFNFKNHNCCPFKAFVTFKKMCEEKSLYSMKVPVFRHEDGKIFTRSNFQKIVGDLLGKRYKALNVKISGHSFRAGIPAALARFPEISSEKHIMGWGRWDSGAYLNYTRLKSDQKRKIFDKIVHVLNSQGNK